MRRRRLRATIVWNSARVGKADIKVKVDQSAGLNAPNQRAQKRPQPTKLSYYIELVDRTRATHVFMMGGFFLVGKK